ncbi:tetratricopeptide repeat protein [Microbulbifer sp. 2304DJ12-6]|uniref:tetratricopeptide repeat protein n=1 Tax=Microbulbifer sp. 2304DJ12-6 TaxID=3233340 RepID=UPI0039B0861A
MKKIFILVSLIIACTIAPVFATSKPYLLANEVIDRSPSSNFPDNAAKYWALRTQAIHFAKSQQWNKAIPLLEKLTKQYEDDGDTWFLLGHGYLQTEQYQKAILPLEQALQLGTIMTGVKSASSPSNDIMIKIAQCYSAIGKKQKALDWLQMALEYRWDDRKSLIKNTQFEKIAHSPEYKKLSGEFLESGLSRNDA